MSVTNPFLAKEEFVVFLRNQNVLSVSERMVTTTSATGSVNGTTITISRTNVRNIRSVTIGVTTLSFGIDYTVNYTNNAGTSQNCLITFTNSQNDTYNISYDYGTDRIFTDYARDDLKVGSSFPRISVEIIGQNSDEISLGGSTIITKMSLGVTVYAASNRQVDTIIHAIRTAVVNNKKSLYYVRFITPIGLGPVINSGVNDKIVQRNIDFNCPFMVET